MPAGLTLPGGLPSNLAGNLASGLASAARPLLNLFSPLPPVHSDIARATLLAAAALQDFAEITLWTAQPEPPEVPDGLAVERFDPAHPPWPRLNRAALNIYNIGNNATFHRAIFDVARQAPGLVVLHDTRLQHFFARYAETPGADRAFYLASMRRSHGAEGLADAQAFLAGHLPLDTLVDRYPMTAAALDGALAAVIHNPASHDGVAAQTRMPVFTLKLPFAGPGPGPRPPPDGTLRLVAFGFMGPNRRIPSVLEALASHPDPAIRLDLYGVLDDAAALEAKAAALGLGNRVRQHGFVPEPVLTAALARADLALNLRDPSMGEASGSQLRIWDAALPCLVTRTGWYATLPDNSVFFVEPARETASIQAHLHALRQDPARYRAAGQRGRAIVQDQHAPAAYATSLAAIAAQAPSLHARQAAIAMARTTARTLLDIGGPNTIETNTDTIAYAIAELTGSAAPQAGATAGARHPASIGCTASAGTGRPIR